MRKTYYLFFSNNTGLPVSLWTFGGSLHKRAHEKAKEYDCRAVRVSSKREAAAVLRSDP